LASDYICSRQINKFKWKTQDCRNWTSVNAETELLLCCISATPQTSQDPLNSTSWTAYLD